MRQLVLAFVLTATPALAQVTADTPNPFEGKADAAEAGHALFGKMNCAGCHAYDLTGGMGPDLTDNNWLYGGKPGEIYHTIAEGTPAYRPGRQDGGRDLAGRHYIKANIIGRDAQGRNGAGIFVQSTAPSVPRRCSLRGGRFQEWRLDFGHPLCQTTDWKHAGYRHQPNGQPRPETSSNLLQSPPWAFARSHPTTA
jgi:mono/diheme cytochrome c family protein